MKKTPQIAFCLDQGYAYATQLAIFSLLKHNPQPLNIFVLGYDLPQATWADFEKIFADFPNATLTAQKLTAQEMPLPKHGRHYISPASYLRLILPTYLSGRVTYLDGDILVRRSIEELTDVELEPHQIIAAMPDTTATRYHFRRLKVEADPNPSAADLKGLAAEQEILNEMLENTDITDPLIYFNAGLYTIDFDRLKEHAELFEKYQSIEGARTIGKGSDQRYLNHLFHDHIKILPFKFNSQMRNAKPIDPAIPEQELANWREARENPVICHFLSKRKPWKSLFKNYTFSGRKRFMEYRMTMRELRKRYGIRYQA